MEKEIQENILNGVDEIVVQIISETKFKDILTFLKFCLQKEIDNRLQERLLSEENFNLWLLRIQNMGNVDAQTTVAALGLGKLRNFTFEQLQNYLENKLAVFEADINTFENKYKMSWKEMDTKFDELTHFGLLEKEDDHSNWITFIDFADFYQQCLKKLYHERNKPNIERF